MRLSAVATDRCVLPLALSPTIAAFRCPLDAKSDHDLKSLDPITIR